MSPDRYKHISLLVRSRGSSHQEFLDRWQSDHVRTVGAMPGVVRYATARPVDPEGSEFDGLSELSFDDMDTLRSALGRPSAGGRDDQSDGMPREDLVSFVDGAASIRFVGRETVEKDITAGDTTGLYKHSAFLVRKEGLTHEAFLDHWRNSHVPIARDIPGVVRYTRVVPVQSDGSPDATFDGVAELYFEDLDALRASLGHESSRDYDPDHPKALEAREDVSEFLAIEKRPRFVGIETVHVDETGGGDSG